MKQFLHFPKFFIDRIQLIFALLLVCVVFAIVYLTIVQTRVQEPPNITPSPTKTSQEFTPTEQNGYLIQPKEAIFLVETLKEVQDARGAATASNTKFVTEIDSNPTNDNYFYVVHAYEVVSDGNGSGHTATVGWYRVNPQTGKVTNADNL